VKVSKRGLAQSEIGISFAIPILIEIVLLGFSSVVIGYSILFARSGGV